jgi:AAA15 family ATPase/GTPase
MISQLVIKNFKSIKQVDIPCKKLNVFIGEPNGGKSNIIEALSLMSQGIINSIQIPKTNFDTHEISREIFRYKSIADFFFDFNINKPIEVSTGILNYQLKYAIREDGEPENRFHFSIQDNSDNNKPANVELKISHNGRIENYGQLFSTRFRYYQYKRISEFYVGSYSHLSPPFGENLPSLLLSNEEYRNWVSEFFETKGFTLTLKPSENEITMSKLVNKNIYSYPYQSVSETLQRIVFYMMAILSNKDSILLFDEPETNTFPFYTKFLAESIALDESNQFFLTTHNPYLLLSLIEKSSVDNINVCVVRMKDYETKVIPLNKEQLTEVLDFNSDVFFNLDRIID